MHLMKRCIIRSFFIGLLLLCVGGWVTSFWRAVVVVRISSTDDRIMECNSGRIAFIFTHAKNTRFPASDQRCVLVTGPAGKLGEFVGRKFLGFVWLNESQDEVDITSGMIPFWFPTLLSAVLLWLVWRWTRPKLKGLAFPIEMNKPSEKP